MLGNEIAVERISQHDALAVCSALPSCGGFSFTTNQPSFGYGHRFIPNPHDGADIHFYDSNETGTANFSGQGEYHSGWVSYLKWDFHD